MMYISFVSWIVASACLFLVVNMRHKRTKNKKLSSQSKWGRTESVFALLGAIAFLAAFCTLVAS